MLTNYLKIALRTIRRNPGFTFLNVAGLSVGLAACVLILFYVQDELGYDTYHVQADRVFRITQEELDENGTPTVHRVLVDPPLAPLLKSTFPEVTHAARLTPVGPLLSYGDRHIDSGDCYWADPDVFEVFSIPFLAGNPQTALTNPFTLVLSATKARALFGEEDPMGKTVVVNNKDAFTVTGVFEDLPHQTHLPIDVLGSLATMERWFGTLGWGSPNYATYVRLNAEEAAAALAEKLPALLAGHQGADAARLNRLHLQPLTDIHLRSHLVGELAPNGDIQAVYLFSVVALFILVIACINFMNLATARSARRAKEVGMRKVSGARRGELIGQFLGESVLLVFLSLLLAMFLVELALPFFNDFTGKALGFRAEDLLVHLALFAGIGLVVGIAAGSYPAFYLSAFRPAVVLKGDVRRGRSALLPALVVFQFAIAIVLLISTFIVVRQLQYINNRSLGFDKAQILTLPTVWDLREDFDPFREQLLQHPDVTAVSQSNPVPSRRLMFSLEVVVQQDDTGSRRVASMYPVFADAHFFPTYHIPFVAGRNFSDELASDAGTGFVLNETAVAALGWATPEAAVGAPLQVGGWRGAVLGVVRDFHFESLHQQIAPMVFYMDPRNYRMVSVKVRAGADLTGLLAFLEDRWQQYEPNSPLSYTFLDERFGAVYESERKLGRLFGAFAGLALVITCLGLFGIAAFTVERRTKEIGIRKVLGASASGIVALCTATFVKYVGVAFLVAVPVAFFAMQQWLAGFAYHAEPAWWLFALAGVVALGVALLTVGYQAARVALADPVQSLRYE